MTRFTESICTHRSYDYG